MKTNIYDATRDFTEKDKAIRQYQNLQENQFKRVLEKDVVNNAKMNRGLIIATIWFAIALVITLVRIVTV